MSRLRRIREMRGLDPHQLAGTLGLNSPWYFDLELDRPDWTDEISIKGLRQLCRALDVSPSSLISGDKDPVATSKDFVDRLMTHLAAKGVSAADFSEEVGWDVGRLLANPIEVGNLNAAGLRAICEALGLDWIAVLDEMKMD